MDSRTELSANTEKEADFLLQVLNCSVLVYCSGQSGVGEVASVSFGSG